MAWLAAAGLGQSGSPQPSESLEALDRAGLRAAVEACRHLIREAESGLQAWNPGNRWHVQFDGRGFEVQPRSGGWRWGLYLLGYHADGLEQPLHEEARISSAGQTVTYAWGSDLEEWYVNDARGLEHGFTVLGAPRGAVPVDTLELTLAVRGGLQPFVLDDGRSVRFVDSSGATAVTYAGLTVFDADGADLRARFDPDPRGLRLTVDVSDARYPVTIDPLAQQAYLKAGHPDAGDVFGESVAVSGDTIAVGVPLEASSATGIDGDAADDSAIQAGAVYVFVRAGGAWSQQAYIKASNTDPSDHFGRAVALDGDTLAVAAWREDSSATGVGGDESDNSSDRSGAVYVFVRDGATWSQQAYIKPSNTGASDEFGRGTSNGVALSGDTLVVGAQDEDSSATGIDGDQDDNSAPESGAAYVFVREGTTWSQQAYLKASNTDAGDEFGRGVDISGDTVVVGAPLVKLLSV